MLCELLLWSFGLNKDTALASWSGCAQCVVDFIFANLELRNDITRLGVPPESFEDGFHDPYLDDGLIIYLADYLSFLGQDFLECPFLLLSASDGQEADAVTRLLNDDECTVHDGLA